VDTADCARARYAPGELPAIPEVVRYWGAAVFGAEAFGVAPAGFLAAVAGLGAVAAAPALAIVM